MSLIVADVGGTNARLAFQKNINSEISLIENFLCSEFKTLEDIIATYKQKHRISNDHISIGVAGPCEDDDVVILIPEILTFPLPTNAVAVRTPTI